MTQFSLKMLITVILEVEFYLKGMEALCISSKLVILATCKPVLMLKYRTCEKTNLCTTHFYDLKLYVCNLFHDCSTAVWCKADVDSCASSCVHCPIYCPFEVLASP